MNGLLFMITTYWVADSEIELSRFVVDFGKKTESKCRIEQGGKL